MAADVLAAGVPQRGGRIDVHRVQWSDEIRAGDITRRGIIDELHVRGEVFRTDVNDATCASNSATIGPDADGKAGGCDNIRVVIPTPQPPAITYWREYN